MLAAFFFRAIFGNAEGFVCVAIKRTGSKGLQEVFYQYPQQLKELHEYVERSKYSGNVYFCPQLLSEPRRIKTNVVKAPCAWADLDTCHPRVLLVPPTISLETSPNRYQAFWAFESPQDPTIGEGISRRIAYFHSDEGADRSGWDLTQLLRVPGTRNFKYGDGPTAPEVKVLEQNDVKYRPNDFARYPQVEGYEHLEVPFPDELIVQEGRAILDAHRFQLSGHAYTLFESQPEEGKRSDALFRLEMLCAEAGMTDQETFQVARDAACNKWPDEPDLLWKDVCRAFSNHQKNEQLGRLPHQAEPDLISEAEVAAVEANPCFVERYVKWAKSLGDAAPQYHQASAFVVLSALLAGSIVLPTSFGDLIPNIWVMVLADTTLSRKTTAMNLAMDLLDEIDPSLMMATDGSIEGLTTGLATRPGKVSIFFRDEFTGLMEQMTKKDYMAGMPEFFTQLYDSRTVVRRLRKEEIRVQKPRLIIFAGGIKSRMQQLVTYEHVSSGFMPRFIFVTAITDVNKVKPLGRPTEKNWGVRDVIKEEMNDMYNNYRQQTPIMTGGKVIGVEDRVFKADLTDDAWARFNKLDQTLMALGMASGDYKEIITPLYARLGFSILKAAVLIAASRKRDASSVLVEEEDVVRAIYYGTSWKKDATEIVSNVGKSTQEHKIEMVKRAISGAQDGRMPRSKLMQRYHLTAQEMNIIEATLEARGLITATQHGRQRIYEYNPNAETS